MNLRFAVILAALAFAPGALGAQDLPVMRVGTLGYNDASSEPLYGAAAGIFRRNGLDVKVSALTGGGAIIAAIAGGSLEAGFSNAVSAAQAIQRGIPIIVLTPAAEWPAERSDTLLVKARGSKLKSAADLNGKIVSVTTLNGGLEASTRLWIDKNGGDSKSVHFLELPGTEMTAALKAGRIDAAMLSEPLLTENRNDVEQLADPFSAVAPRWTVGVFVASKAWVTANPDLARKFVQGMMDTAHWANTHHAETAKIVAPLAGIPLSTFTLMARSRYGYELSAALLQPEVDQAVANGQLKAAVDTAQWVADAQPYWRGVKR
ncbi:MAG TPA: ABC transporter substrate-binding protein [Candidatus Lustribacter sp.]|jgi:NitT/TauT family transport system substrate-binding protein|nr:ABC transporter substrate-binding protein [Candidatus Lustribacter sp.]